MSALLDQVLIDQRGPAAFDGDPAPSWQDDFAEMVRRIRAKHRADGGARRLAILPAPGPLPRKSRAQLLIELQAEQSGFDPAYAMSDDYGVYTEQAAKHTRITALRAELARAE